MGETWAALQVEGDLKVAPKPAAAQPIADGESGGGSPQGQVEPMDTGETAPSNAPENEGEAAAASPEEKRRQKRGEKLLRVLRGQASIQLYLEFLHSHNHADLQVTSPGCLVPPSTNHVAAAWQGWLRVENV